MSLLECTEIGTIPDYSFVYATNAGENWSATLYVPGVNQCNGITIPSDPFDRIVSVFMYGVTGVSGEGPPAKYGVINNATGAASWVNSYNPETDTVIVTYYNQTAEFSWTTSSSAAASPSALNYLIDNNIKNVTVTSPVAYGSLPNLVAVGFDQTSNTYRILSSNLALLDSSYNFVGFGLKTTAWSGSGPYTATFTLSGLIPSVIADGILPATKAGDLLYCKDFSLPPGLTTNISDIVSGKALLVGQVYGDAVDSAGVVIPGYKIIMRVTPLQIGV